jgi:hypothetical protein
MRNSVRFEAQKRLALAAFDWAELQRSHVSGFAPQLYVFLSDPGCLMRPAGGAGVGTQTPASGFPGQSVAAKVPKKGRETP